ncbi:MAG: hypothetical protein RMJ98_10035 [Myxococcales bacterium]|nr:hypothetical protein [Polyangiaceae bacterium]MDW8249628.1 hypothetical protein [Myxococcales bacterium]
MICFVLLFLLLSACGLPPPSVPTVVEIAPASSLPLSVTPRSPDPRIRRISPESYEVEASLFEALLDDPSRWLPRAWLEPETRDGEIVGYRLGGVTPGGILDRLGLANDDRIEVINGERLRGPEVLEPIRASARRTAQVTVILDRNGFHKLMIYRLVYH